MDWDDCGKAEIWRAAATNAINDALQEAGFTQGFVDHRSYARQGIERIPMVHEGPDARAMEKRGIRTEVGNQTRAIREQNKLLDQLEARLTRLNAWAQFEKKMDAILIAKGEDVSQPDLRFLLASRIFKSTVPPKRRDNRLRDASGLLVIMHDYNITDAASYAMAVKQVNTKFYDLRSRRRKNADLSTTLAARISTYEDRKNYLRYYNAWSKLTGPKCSAFEKRYEFELRKYREAGDILKRWEADCERIDYKGWREALKHLNKERFLLDYELREQKEEVHRLEIVQRQFVKENKKMRPERYER